MENVDKGDDKTILSNMYDEVLDKFETYKQITRWNDILKGCEEYVSECDQ